MHGLDSTKFLDRLYSFSEDVDSLEFFRPKDGLWIPISGYFPDGVIKPFQEFPKRFLEGFRGDGVQTLRFRQKVGDEGKIGGLSTVFFGREVRGD